MTTAAHYDVIVVGTGGIGSAALWQLCKRGVRVLGLDRFGVAHDRGSSHGQTRMIRQAYFEHPDYVPLVRLAYDHWAELARRTQKTLYRQTGLLEVGPRDGVVVPGVLAAAEQHGLAVEELSAAEAEARFAGFCVPDAMVAVVEREAGFLFVEDCITACIDEARRLGARLRTGVEVRSWRVERSGVSVETDTGRFHAGHLIITAGPWAADLLSELRIPLQVRRKPLYWYKTSEPAHGVNAGCPGFLYDLPGGVFYGFPALDDRGLKMGQHSGGRIVDNPLQVDRDVDVDDQMRVEAFAAGHLPGVSRTCTDHAVCMYTMTPDEHFVVDRHPEHPQVALAAGLSGHGFKFAPVLGEALADIVLEGSTSLPVSFLSLDRPDLL